MSTLEAIQAKVVAVFSLMVVWIGIGLGYPPPDRRQRRLTSAPWYAPDYVFRNHWEAGSTSLLEPVDKAPPSWIECSIESLPRKLWPFVVLAFSLWLVVL